MHNLFFFSPKSANSVASLKYVQRTFAFQSGAADEPAPRRLLANVAFRWREYQGRLQAVRYAVTDPRRLASVRQFRATGLMGGLCWAHKGDGRLGPVEQTQQGQVWSSPSSL